MLIRFCDPLFGPLATFSFFFPSLRGIETRKAFGKARQSIRLSKFISIADRASLNLDLSQQKYFCSLSLGGQV